MTDFLLGLPWDILSRNFITRWIYISLVATAARALMTIYIAGYFGRVILIEIWGIKS